MKYRTLGRSDIEVSQICLGSSATAGTLNVTNSGADAVVDFDGAGSITIIGQAGNIDANDFIF